MSVTKGWLVGVCVGWVCREKLISSEKRLKGGFPKGSFLHFLLPLQCSLIAENIYNFFCLLFFAGSKGV